MRFAVISNEQVEASPNLKAVCAGCGEPVTAKCGKQRIWHWAHKAKVECDRWWETETAWHRSWKDKFPREWQEKIHLDETGEKHIADVKTSHGLVIEFQHSHLDPEERAKRERFYKNMIWVIDGTRLKKDYARFMKGKDTLLNSPKQGFFRTPFPEKCFPASWLNSEVPVIFDFRGVIPANPADMIAETLWCILPGRAEQNGVVMGLSRNDLVSYYSNSPEPIAAREIVEIFAQHIRDLKANAAYQVFRNRRRSRF